MMNTKSLKSYGAVGDGRTDDGPALRTALSDATLGTLIIENTGSGYWIDMSPAKWQTVRIFSGVTIRGEGWGSRLIRGGVFSGSTYLFTNANIEQGNSGITIDGVNIDGRWDKEKKGTAWIGPGNPNMTILKIAADNSLGHYVRGFEMINCDIRNWPGIVLSALAHDGTVCANNHIDRISGGGLVFRFVCREVVVERNRITNACDDTLAFNARVSGNPNDRRDGPAVNCTSQRNIFSRFNPEWAGGNAVAPVVSLRGGKRIVSNYDRIVSGPGPGIGITASAGLSDVHFNNTIIENVRGPAIEVGTGCTGTATIRTRNTGAPVNQSTSRFKITRRPLVT